MKCKKPLACRRICIHMAVGVGEGTRWARQADMHTTTCRYYRCYHPVFPILSTSVRPDATYRASPLLFWTIVATAARHDGADFSLLPTLLPAVKELLWSTIPNAPHTLPSLQAMALLCHWPFPVSTMPEDISFILSCTLRAAATHVGLHRPQVLELYSRTRTPLSKPDLTQAVRAWCCIYLSIERYQTSP